MIKKFLFFALVFSLNTLQAQTIYLTDDFEDGNLNGWTSGITGDWIASNTSPINGSYSVRHNLTGVTGSSYIYHLISNLDVTAGETTWRFKLKNGNWEPSNNDKFWMYILIDGIDGNGYSVGVNKGGNSDTLRLIRVTSGIAVSTPISAPFRWGINDVVGIEVTRDRTGLWSMNIDTTGGYSNFIDCGSVFDDTYTICNFIALSFYYTPTSAGSLWMDDVLVSQVSGVSVPVKVFLEGPFNTTNNNMNITLRTNGYLPLSQPYSISPWNYPGAESVSSIPANVVDWILIELRTGTASSTTAARGAGFLLANGNVVDTSGTQPVFFSLSDSGDYYIVTYHRNHLTIMSAQTVHLSLGTTTYDFSTGLDKTYGTNAQKLLDTGIYGMYAGDANANRQIQNDDKNTYWQSQSGSSGYRSADFNLNGQVQNDDKNTYWQINTGRGSQVP